MSLALMSFASGNGGVTGDKVSAGSSSSMERRDGNRLCSVAGSVGNGASVIQ